MQSVENIPPRAPSRWPMALAFSFSAIVLLAILTGVAQGRGLSSTELALTLGKLIGRPTQLLAEAVKAALA